MIWGTLESQSLSNSHPGQVVLQAVASKRSLTGNEDIRRFLTAATMRLRVQTWLGGSGRSQVWGQGQGQGQRSASAAGEWTTSTEVLTEIGEQRCARLCPVLVLA